MRARGLQLGLSELLRSGILQNFRNAERSFRLCLDTLREAGERHLWSSDERKPRSDLAAFGLSPLRDCGAINVRNFFVELGADCRHERVYPFRILQHVPHVIRSEQ